MRRLWLVAAIASVVLFAAVGSVAAEEPTPAEACDVEAPAGETTAIVTLPGVAEPIGPGEEATLYPDSTLSVVLCSGDSVVDPDDGTGWELVDDPDGLTGAEVREDRWVAQTGSVATTIDLEDWIELERVDRAATVAVTTGLDAESDLEGVDSIRFASAEAEAAYPDAEAEFFEAIDQFEDRTEALETVAEDVEARGLDPELEEEANGTLDEIDEAADELEAAGDRNRALLFESAFVAETTGAADALEASFERQADAEREAVESIEDRYGEAIESERAGAAASIRQYLLVGAGVGVLVGLLGGFVVPHRRGKEVRQFYDHDAELSYDWRVLVVPLAVAAVLFALGIMVLVLNDTYRVIV